MLRITVEEKNSLTTFRLEGKLKSEWVGELERCWIYARNTRLGSHFSIDLSSVDFVDEKGKSLLVRMVSEGVELHASNPMMASFVKEIKRLSTDRMFVRR
jgi:ABC-type transporter Mla MlaB component